MPILCKEHLPFGRSLKLQNMGIQPETILQNEIRLAISAQCRDAVIFRNHTGALKDQRTGRLVQFGLAPGSPDLIGWKMVQITPDMVGQQLAVFCGIEIKTPTGRIRPDQRNWLQRLSAAGGVAGVARSVADALHLLADHAMLPPTE